MAADRAKKFIDRGRRFLYKRGKISLEMEVKSKRQ